MVKLIQAAQKGVDVMFKSKIPMKGEATSKVSPWKVAGTTAFLATLFPGITFRIVDDIQHEVGLARREAEGRDLARTVSAVDTRAKVAAFREEMSLINNLRNNSLSREAKANRESETDVLPSPQGFKPLVKVSKGTRSRVLQFASLASLGGVEVARKAALALFATDVLSGVITGNSTSGADFGDTFLDVVKLYSIGATADGLL